MHILGLIVLTVAKILRIAIDIYTLIVAITVLVSWVSPDPYNPIVRFLYQATRPVFNRVRRILPAAFFRTAFDPTPLIVFVLLIVLDTLGVGLLFELAGHLMSK